ncbi:hypothetical protein D3C71_1593960 [compost metagenome]
MVLRPTKWKPCRRKHATVSRSKGYSVWKPTPGTMPLGTMRFFTWMAAIRPGCSTRSSSGTRKSICAKKCSLLSVCPKSA